MSNNLKILRTQDGSETAASPCVLCLGNFDGVHLGHAALLDKAVEQKKLLSTSTSDVLSGVLTFSEQTHQVLSGAALPKITDLEEKRRLFAAHGIDRLIVVDFHSVKNMSPESFVEQILKKTCGCIMTVCGFNFRFGAGGVGNYDTLSHLMSGNAVTVPPVELDGITVSSTAIRAAVAAGDIEKANLMLGRPFSVQSVVKHGRGVGNSLGFATINQHFKKGHLIPARGVYAACCVVDGTSLPAISNVGVHPTFGDGDEVVCETHILDFRGDLYGKSILTQLHSFIRPEQRFASPALLAEEVARNIESARSYFSAKISPNVKKV